MSFNFTLSIKDVSTTDGKQIEKFRMDRAIKILSKNHPYYVMGTNNPDISCSTMASILNRSDFPQKYNDNPEILKLAFKIYQSKGYTDINSFLRKNNGLAREKGELAEACDVRYSVEDIIDALDYLIEIQPETEEDIILYRAIGSEMKGFYEEEYSESEMLMYQYESKIKRAGFDDFNISEFISLSDENFNALGELIGKSYKNEGYTSTSFCSNPTGHSFMGCKMIIAIRVPKGTKVLGPFVNYGESEILLGRGYEFKIQGMEYIDGKIMTYVDLQPRELENSTKPIEELKMPEPLKGTSLPNCDIPDFTQPPQQEIIDDIKNRRKVYEEEKARKTDVINQIQAMLKKILEMVGEDYSSIKSKYQCLQLDFDDGFLKDFEDKITYLQAIVNESELDLEQSEKALNIILNSTEKMKYGLRNLRNELEKQFCNVFGIEIQKIIRDNEIEDLEQQAVEIQSRKITIIEKIFGKAELHYLMIENIEKQIKERKKEPLRSYSNIVDLYKYVLEYTKEKGMPEKLKNFLLKYKNEDISEEEEILFEQITNQEIKKEHDEMYEVIPLFDIRRRSKALKEELEQSGSKKIPQNKFTVSHSSSKEIIGIELQECISKIGVIKGSEEFEICKDLDANFYNSSAR